MQRAQEGLVLVDGAVDGAAESLYARIAIAAAAPAPRTIDGIEMTSDEARITLVDAF